MKRKLSISKSPKRRPAAGSSKVRPYGKLLGPSGEELRVSVIIPAMNEAGTIGRVVAQALAVASGCEVIVVANGSRDATAEEAAKAGARVIVYKEPLGHDVGRSVGAEAAGGDVLIFTDGDFHVSAAELRPFAEAVARGTDVALNDYSGPVASRRPHPVVLAKHALNDLLRRPDLKGCSMTAVPHGLSRRALEILGTAILSCPPAAHAAAVTEGLKVQRVRHIPVGRRNAKRRRKRGTDLLQEQVVGDHYKAVCLLLDRLGGRAGFGDGTRRRELVRVW